MMAFTSSHFRLLQEETTLASSRELSHFLESVERRAFKQAIFAVREEESALDIVQDSMLKLAEKYGDRPADHPASAFTPDDDEDYDPLETLAADEDAGGTRTPESLLLQAQTLNMIDDEIKKLPTRQREAFLMRYWEDMDVAETAAAMGCSEGSVKTHCSRATHALATALSARGIKL